MMKKYKRIELLARAILIEELIRQEKSLNHILSESVERVRGAMETIFENRRFDNLEERFLQYMLQFDDALAKELNVFLTQTIEKGLEAGTLQYLLLTKEVLAKNKIPVKPFLVVQQRADQRAVEAAISKQIQGLNLSDRIWSTSRKINQSLGQIAIEGLREGKHPVEVAKRMQRYVKAGKKTMVTEYPNMMERIGDMLPDALSYEALRLARTEMADAYGQAEKRTAEEAPFSKGIKWSVSNAGVACKVCQANADLVTDLGVGVYAAEDLPKYPAHPNCLCDLQQVVEDIVGYARRVKEWTINPQSQPDIELWYKTVYVAGK